MKLKYMFIRIEEGDVENRTQSCLLLIGDRAQEFIEDSNEFIGEYGDEAVILDSWTVPEDLENATASDSIREAFDALLALNALSDSPVVSDLYATIFEAGYQLATKKKEG